MIGWPVILADVQTCWSPDLLKSPNKTKYIGGEENKRKQENLSSQCVLGLSIVISLTK